MTQSPDYIELSILMVKVLVLEQRVGAKYDDYSNDVSKMRRLVSWTSPYSEDEHQILIPIYSKMHCFAEPGSFCRDLAHVKVSFHCSTNCYLA